MDFKKLDPKNLIVRLMGDHLSYSHYGIVKSNYRVLRYYPLNSFDGLTHVSHRTNTWEGQVARSELGYPRQFQWRHHRYQLDDNKKEIKNKIQEVCDRSIKEKVESYVKHVIPPYVIDNWKNRVWPIPTKYLDQKQRRIRKLFLELGNFQ